MGKGLTRSMERGDRRTKPINTVRYRRSGVTLTVDGATGVGFGSFNLGGLPEGQILLLGAVGGLKLDKNGEAGIVDAFDGDFGFGTSAADDGTITGTDVNIIGSTTKTQASGGVSARQLATNATQAFIDNTDGDAVVSCNVLIDNDDISADDVDLLADVELDIAYIVMNDD